MINAIAHGNLGIIKKHPSEDLGEMAKKEQSAHPSTKRVYVNFEISEKRVSIRIQDEGNGFKHDDVPNPLAGEGLMQTKGRGLFLMESFFDSVKFNKKGNEVIMIKEKK